MRILLVEDDLLVGESIKEALQFEGHAVDWITSGQEALSVMSNTNPHELVLLDLGLPDIGGIEVLTQSRLKGLTIPVIILTARDGLHDRIGGLDAGADDYLVKPFDIEELFARMRSLVRRAAGRAMDELTFGSFTVYSKDYTVFFQGRDLEATRSEYVLLSKLIQSKGRTVSKQVLEDALFAWDSQVSSNAVEVYMSRLRKKMPKGSIETIRGIGYRLKVIEP
ncbi:MAG: response regulator transcription factor [Bermanella sp.]